MKFVAQRRRRSKTFLALHTGYFSQDGVLDFELFEKPEPFLQDFAKAARSAKQGCKVMRAEKEPAQCHRSESV
jgi:hypothetical protein